MAKNGDSGGWRQLSIHGATAVICTLTTCHFPSRSAALIEQATIVAQRYADGFAIIERDQALARW
jgi:hypothetical protein